MDKIDKLVNDKIQNIAYYYNDVPFYWFIMDKKKLSLSDYDVKNLYANERRTELRNTDDKEIKNSAYHYDGYMYNGEYFSARSLGNILFGRNIENILLPNSFMIDMAGRYQAKSNNTKVNKETPEALKGIDYGIEEQKAKNVQKEIEKIGRILYVKSLVERN